MKIVIPDMQTQLRIVFERSTIDAIKQLKRNLTAPIIRGVLDLDESQYSDKHMMLEHEYEAPHHEIVTAYFKHFQAHFRDYDTDKKLAALLGLSGDRRIRAFKNGEKKVPYNIWRRFLVLTGRVQQEIIPVMAYVPVESSEK